MSDLQLDRGSAKYRVAVIIPCFNDGRTVLETLASLAAQERCDVVIIDDGSDEHDTLEQLARLQAAGVKVVRQENRGLAAARMRGVAATTAPYIFPLDADDLLPPGALAKLADALDDHPAAGMAWGDQCTFGEVELRQQRARSLDPWAITYVNQLPASMIRREALLSTGGWVLKLGYEDWDLWMSLAERGWEGVWVDAVTFRYRVSPSRMLAAARGHHEQLFAEMRRRHPKLYRERRANWLRSVAPLRMRILLPLVERLPTTQLWRHRISLAIAEPAHAVRVRLARRTRRG